jgi:hypothetical protein
LAATDERASLRGEYEILLDGVSTAKSIRRHLRIHSPLSRGSQAETYVHLPAGGSQADAEPDIRICHDTSYVRCSTAYVGHDTDYAYDIRYVHPTNARPASEQR